MTLPPTNRRLTTQQTLFLTVGLVAAVLIVFGRAIGFDYVDWDDTVLVLNNPILKSDSPEGLGTVWRAPYIGLYAPLTYTVYAGVAWAARAAGEAFSPAYFHLPGVLLHAASAVLLWAWLRRLGAGPIAAWVAAVLWAVHPLQAEPVAWVSGLNSVLAGFFAIVALLLATAVKGDGGGRFAWLAASAVAIALSVTAKPSSVMLPAIGVIVHRLVLKRTWRETLLLGAIWAVVVAPFVWIGSGAQVNVGTLFTPPPVADRPLVALHAVGFYLIKFFCPLELAMDYGQSPAIVLADGRWIGPAAVAGLLLVTAILALKKRPRSAAGMLVFAVALLPVLGFVPFYFQAYSTVADRYAYLPLVGLALAVSAALPDDERLCRLPAAGVAGVTLLVLAVLTFRQVGVWRDSATLFSHAYAVNPTGIAAAGQTGLIAARAGDLALAEQALGTSLQRRPGDASLRAEFAGVLLRSGQSQRAADEFNRSLTDEPNNPLAQNGLGLALVALGRDEEALLAFGKAWQQDRRFADAPANAGDVLRRLGRSDAARGAYTQALRINPNHPRARLGLQSLPPPPATTRP